jgi:signal transduction histidine kinase
MAVRVHASWADAFMRTLFIRDRMRAVLCGVTFLMFATVGVSAAEPRRVLLLHSFGPDYSPWGETAASFRTELFKQSPDPIDLYEASVFTARFETPHEEGPFIDYLRALFSDRKLDLIVASGAPAANFVQRHRSLLFPSTPMIMTALAQTRVSEGPVSANDTAVALALDLQDHIRNILRLRPKTKNVVVVIGNSQLEKYWLKELRQLFESFQNQVSFTWLNNSSFDAILSQAASLTPQSAIFYFLLAADAEGVPHVQDQTIEALHRVATAPIFGFGDYELGRGIVGGPLNPTQALGREAAGVATRILKGEAPSNIKTLPMGFGPWSYDWRELKRRQISESLLPPGSIVQFRELTVWERYRWQTSLVAFALLGQMLLITWLLYERRRRHRAEVATRQRATELVHMNRRAVAGQMSASIAHEVNQPLTAILFNAETLHDLLGRERPDLGKIREIVVDIIAEDTRASEVIDRIRKFLQKDESKSEIVDLNELVASTMHLLHGDLVKRKTSVETALAADLPAIGGDPVQLQQVLLNLLINAIDAVGSKSPPRRMIKISTRANGKHVEANIADFGHGIAADNQQRLFEPFFTTKEHGLGLGLSICSTIVNAHGGRLSIDNNDHGGATVVLSFLSAQAALRQVS